MVTRQTVTTLIDYCV